MYQKIQEQQLCNTCSLAGFSETGGREHQWSVSIHRLHWIGGGDRGTSESSTDPTASLGDPSLSSTVAVVSKRCWGKNL